MTFQNVTKRSKTYFSIDSDTFFLGVCISWCSCWIFSFRYSICMLNAVILSKYIKVCIEEEESSLSNETVRFLTYLWRKIFCLKSMLNRNLATYRVLKKSGSMFKTKKQNFNRFNFLFPTCQSKHVSIFKSSFWQTCALSI